MGVVPRCGALYYHCYTSRTSPRRYARDLRLSSVAPQPVFSRAGGNARATKLTTWPSTSSVRKSPLGQGTARRLFARSCVAGDVVTRERGEAKFQTEECASVCLRLRVGSGTVCSRHPGTGGTDCSKLESGRLSLFVGSS